MEKECVSVSNSNTVHLDETRTQSSEESPPLMLQDFSQRPTTSRASSMSQLQEDEYCVTNSQHDFAEVVDDDETTTSGVLETFEISSSNSLPPTSSDAPVAPVVAVEDSSSTDTLRHDGGDHSDSLGSESRHAATNFFNSGSEVYIINDEDEDEEDGDVIDDVIDNDVHDDGDVESRLEENTNPAVSLERHLNGIIVTADGSKIFLETPVVEEQLHHHNQLGNLGDDLQIDYNEKAGKPKRLSDEFMLEENIIEHSLGNEMKYAQVVKPLPEFVSMEMASSSSLTNASVVGCDRFNINVGSVETSHDRIMSVRLKKMSLTNTNNSNNNIHNIKNIGHSGNATNLNIQDMSTISQFQGHQGPSIADIESMDLIERRDFETEQRLTGGTILKSSSILSKNMLNISLIKSCMQQQQKKNLAHEQPNDDWPSSSHGHRVVSSDSKCSYKDLMSTPTSSRKYSSNRLTKSTAKINLCSTLSSSLNHSKLAASCAETENSSVPFSASSVIVEPIAATSSMSSSLSCNLPLTGDARTEMYNTNSNPNEENFASTTTVTPTLKAATNSKGIYQNDYGHTAATQQPAPHSELNASNAADIAELAADVGCSRTNALHAYSVSLAFDDAQPSTSSARCQYGPLPRSGRQVNASAQTNERFLSRSAGLGCDIAFVGVTGERMRRRTDSAVQTMQRSNGGQDDIILVDSEGIVTERGVNGEFNADDSWADCDEDNIGSDLEEICTCQQSAFGGSSHGGSSTSLNETVDMLDVACDSYILDDIVGGGVTESVLATAPGSATTVPGQQQQRKRKYNEGRLLDSDYCLAVTNSGGTIASGENICRKRIAYDFASTPRSSQAAIVNIATSMTQTPTASLSFACGSAAGLIAASGSPMGRRTPRSLIPTRDNPPPELQQWLTQFQRWSHAERLVAVDRLIDHCDPAQVRHMMKVIEPQFQRDFISLLPRELALSVLSYLDPKDLLRAAQTCRSWRFLCDDNLLWKEKCRKEQILTEPRTDRPKRGRAGNMPPIASPWKAAYMRQHIIEMNWRSRPVREPKVLKGHDDHVITCLQFSGNRIVSGSDDNTLKVWSAVTGRCLRTLVGHTGGVWSSQMSGNIIISGSTDRTLKVWDMETGLCVHTLQGHTSTVRCMHLHGDKVVSGSRDATLRVWDIEQGSCLHVLVGHLAAVRCVQYDGKLIVSGAYDYMVKIWHPERQECLHTLQGHTNRVYSLQFDGIHVVSGSLDTSIRVWDAETGNCKHTLMGHQSLTSGMELRQNILVSGNADSTVKVWDITTGQCLQTLSGPNKHQSAVTCLQFNSRFVVTSSDDGTVKLWDVKTGDFIRNLVALESGGSGGVVWRIRANDTKLICAVGSRNGTEETKLMVLDFDVEGACVKCS